MDLKINGLGTRDKIDVSGAVGKGLAHLFISFFLSLPLKCIAGYVAYRLARHWIMAMSSQQLLAILIGYVVFCNTTFKMENK